MVVRGFLILLIFCVVSCSGGQGTEVTNVANPHGPQTFKIEYWTVELEIPSGWSYYEYAVGEAPGPEAFTDISEQTRTAAHFERGDRGFFTVFETLLKEGQTLEAFVKERHDSDIVVEEINSPDSPVLYSVYYSYSQKGPRGGFFLFEVFMADDEGVLWMRTELVGSQSEQAETWQEFWEIVNTAKITLGG